MHTLRNTLMLSRCRILAGLPLLNTLSAFTNGDSAPAINHRGAPDRLFVGVHWRMTDFKLDQAIDFDGDGQIDTDLMTFLKPCELDNTLLFGADGTMRVDEGNLACAAPAGVASSKRNTWRYDPSTNRLTIKRPGSRKTAVRELIETSKTHLKVRIVTARAEPSSAATVTWQAQ